MKHREQIEAKIQRVEELKHQFALVLEKESVELFALSNNIEDYREAYCFMKAVTHSQEEFNVAMGRIRETLLK